MKGWEFTRLSQIYLSVRLSNLNFNMLPNLTFEQINYTSKQISLPNIKLQHIFKQINFSELNFLNHLLILKLQTYYCLYIDVKFILQKFLTKQVKYNS